MGQQRKKSGGQLIVTAGRHRTNEETNRASARSNVPRIEMARLADLTPHPNSPHIHPKRQIKKIRASLRAYGFVLPILIDSTGMIVAGHARVIAAEELDYKEVPAIRVTHLTAEQLRAYHIADNRLSEDARWDHARLAIEFEFLANADFDLQLTGFETPEIDLIMGNARDQEFDDLAEDEVELPDETKPAISRVGDLWLLGEHRLLCGDARSEDVYRTLMAGELADQVVTDSPWNVRVQGHVSGLGRVHHREFAMASGEMTSEEFKAFLIVIFCNLVKFSRDGSLHYAFIDAAHLLEMLLAGREAYTRHLNVLTWVKSNAGMGSLYRSKTEQICLFKNGTAPHTNNIELGKHGRYRTTALAYPGANTFSKSRSKKLESHPTVKSVAMIHDLILDTSRAGDIVLDPFAGSGTIFVAAEKAKRRGYGIELDPLYVDSTIRRWEKLTEQRARHAELNLTLDEVAALRRDTNEF